MLHPAFEKYFDLLHDRERLLTAAIDEISTLAYDGESHSAASLFGARRLTGEVLYRISHYAHEVIGKGQALVQTPDEIVEELRVDFDLYEKSVPADDAQLFRSFEPFSDANESAFALTHIANINGECPHFRVMTRQYEKRIQALTEVLVTVRRLASDGLMESWPRARRKALRDIVYKTLGVDWPETRIPEWYDMEVKPE